MFVFDEDCEKLRKNIYETFHNLVEKMLFATKISQTDAGTSISYLTTRVRDPDQIYWMKMVNLFKYIGCTKDIPLILSAYNSGMLKWYIYGSHAVHPNMRGSTRGGLTMGRGLPILLLRKQKLNTRSSTKS